VITGVVAHFDERRGDGVVRTDDSGSYYFHCVSIADGSRRIRVGARVHARRVAGHVGHDEAAEVTPLD